MLPISGHDRVGRLETHLREICALLAEEARAPQSGESEAEAISRAMDRLLAAVSRALVDSPDDTTDEFGRARAGSQLQTQLYVNLFPNDLNEAILPSLPTLAARRPIVRWISPCAADHYREYRDALFLETLGLEKLRVPLIDFWPARGPRWDALARLDFSDGHSGVLLVEAKAHSAEVLGGGCGAAGSRRERIEGRLKDLATQYGLTRLPETWMEQYYQSANRLAHLEFLRARNIDAWLANVYFSGDWNRATTEAEWNESIAEGKRAMELTKELTYSADVILQAKSLTLLSLPAGPSEAE